MKSFGLIGKTLKHSFSKEIHALLGEYAYELYELSEKELNDFISGDICGFNVTIPFKQVIMNYLDYISDKAKDIGAVNTVVKEHGKLKGYNTDFDGMKYMIYRAGISLTNKTVMILGSGGTSKTAQSVAKSLGAKQIIVVSRQGDINYSNYQNYSHVNVIINTTPVGMFPESGFCAIKDLDTFDDLTGVIDVVYNPLLTKLTFMAREKGLKYTNGLPMLVAQAKYSMELFMGEKKGNVSENFSDIMGSKQSELFIPDEKIENIIKIVENRTRNIVLIGMPGSGKSTIGRLLAEKLHREFIDTDNVIEEKENKKIPDIFSEFGEEYFRKKESEVVYQVGKLQGKVIATGGGVVKNKDNYYPLKQNSTLIYIDRNIESLDIKGRPLSVANSVYKLRQEREVLYEQFKDIRIENNGPTEDTIKEIMKKL